LDLNPTHKCCLCSDFNSLCIGGFFGLKKKKLLFLFPPIQRYCWSCKSVLLLRVYVQLSTASTQKLPLCCSNIDCFHCLFCSDAWMECHEQWFKDYISNFEFGLSLQSANLDKTENCCLLTDILFNCSSRIAVHCILFIILYLFSCFLYLMFTFYLSNALSLVFSYILDM